MTSPNVLEINGKISEHPLAELLVEIFHSRLNGSLRLTNDGQKIIIYFDGGSIVFAVSNARRHRLFELLLRENILNKQQLLSIADFTDDFKLSENLLKNNLLLKTDTDALFSRQIKEIFHTALDWKTGEWIFSPHIRIKGEIRFNVDLPQLLIEYARKLSPGAVVGRFKSLREMFGVNSVTPVQVNLLPEEAFIFSRFEHSLLSIEKISALSGMAEDEALKILYTLWLGGFLSRQEWNAAFNARKTAAILSANFTLKKEEKTPVIEPQESKSADLPETLAEVKTPLSESQEAAPAEEKLLLKDYLYRVENATNHYEILGILPDAPVAKVKQAYFSLAKQFHPDLFYKETDTKLFQRIQHAFTLFAQAYETLKTETLREVYDYRMRKEIAEMELRAENAGSAQDSIQADQAAENFEQGFNYLMEENNEAALPYLARAVHFAEENARYHAYYGKALSFDGKQRHKAEAELQTAIKLDAENADFRIMLAEFFIQIGFLKRAEGELNRLLAIFPNNKEALAILDNLAKSEESKK